MKTIKLKIAELRKEKGISQQDLADVLGVSFQSVSKWETATTMPDITLLPSIAQYFQVSIDELLGLKPLPHEKYIKRDSDNHDKKSEGLDKLYQNRKYFWNDDYLKFLIDSVWQIHKPIDVIDFRCCNGYMGRKLLEFLPKGSTYTGIDSKHFIQQAKTDFNDLESAYFIESDLYSFQSTKKYDMAICQAGLRHMNRPMEILKKMIEVVKEEGLVICVEVNREFEQDGLYIEGFDYDSLCTTFDYHKLWKKELLCEGRDYAVGMRIPFFMQQLGLHDIDIRMNDKVLYVHPQLAEYEEEVNDFIGIHVWDTKAKDNEELIQVFMSRGYERAEVNKYIEMQHKISEYFLDDKKEKSFLKVNGLLITFGRK